MITNAAPDYGSLLTYRELKISGPDGALARLGDEFAAALPTGAWARDTEKEREISGTPSTGGFIGFVFTYKGDMSKPPSNLFLMRRPGEVILTNIVPARSEKLSIEEYNALIEAFIAAADLNSVTTRLGLQTHLTDAVRPITAWLTESAAKKLWAFSASANKSTGSVHPRDRERWYDFIIQVHADDCTLSTDLLRRWLIEVEDWPDEPEEIVQDLVIEYEFGLGLLERQAAHPTR